MRKLRIYLDTSVISYLQAEDVPEKMASTLKLWNEIMEGKYDVIMARESIVMKELHEIRAKNYEATKNMTNEERIRFINERANKARQRMKEIKKARFEEKLAVVFDVESMMNTEMFPLSIQPLVSYSS